MQIMERVNILIYVIIVYYFTHQEVLIDML